MIGYEPEWVLMAVAIGLYLYDSALLLYANEGVITTSGGGWSVAFASTLRLARKELFLPSPVFAHRPVFRLTWGFPQVHSGVDTSWSARAELFTALAYPIWGMMLAVFALLPLGLFTRLGDRFVLAACVLLYVNIAVALGWLAHRRAAFGLTARRLAALAFEVLICPPFALNLVRKLVVPSCASRKTWSLPHGACKAPPAGARAVRGSCSGCSGSCAMRTRTRPAALP